MRRTLVTTLLQALGLGLAVSPLIERYRQHGQRGHERHGRHDRRHPVQYRQHRYPVPAARRAGCRSTLIRQAPPYQPPRRRLQSPSDHGPRPANTPAVTQRDD